MRTESELVILIYALYLWDCIHWIQNGQTAYLKNGEKWERKQIDRLSFTLLGRMPVVRNPLSTRPGIIVVHASEDLNDHCSDSKSVRRTIRIFRKRAIDLSMYSAISGCLLLLVLPALIMMNLIAAQWKSLAAALFIGHVAVISEFYRTCSDWRLQSRQQFIEALVALSLNPLSAIRCPDVAMKWKFSAVSSHALDIAFCQRDAATPTPPRQSESSPSSPSSPEA